MALFYDFHLLGGPSSDIDFSVAVNANVFDMIDGACRMRKKMNLMSGVYLLVFYHVCHFDCDFSGSDPEFTGDHDYVKKQSWNFLTSY